MGHSQAEAAAFAHRLGGEERLEQRSAMAFSNARAVILDLHEQLATVAPPAQPYLASRAGLGGVAQQIGQRLLETRRVDPAMQCLRRRLQLQADFEHGQLVGHRRSGRMRQHLGRHTARG